MVVSPADFSSPQLKPSDVTAFADASATVIAEELRQALAPGIQLLQPLGAGGMGLVFLARDPLLKRLVAIKVLAPNLADSAVARARFVREAEASAAVAHPNVAGIFLVGELSRSKTPYFVMQYVEGRSLAAEMSADGGGGVMSETRAKRLVGEVASALAAAHARGLVHRDIKPANIIIESESDRPVVLDFGISAVLQRDDASTLPSGAPETRLTRAGTYIGTPTYMSPEQAAGEPVTGKSDVYALGVMGYEMLAGRPPFEGPPVVVMASHLEKTPPALSVARPGVDRHLADLVERCLEKDPDKRPAAADIAQSLLPGRRDLIEWPPPGLETFPGLGAQLVRRWGATGALTLLFFLLLYIRPTYGSPKWEHGEQSILWSGLMAPVRAIASENVVQRQRVELARWTAGTSATTDTTPVWMFLVGMDVAALLLLVMLNIGYTARFARHARAASRAGYPWRVLLDASWSQDSEVGALLNGSGAFALVTTAQRERLMRLRRARIIVTAAAVVATLVAPFFWLGGALRVAANPSESVVTGTELLLMLLPAVIGLIVIAVLDSRTREGALGGLRRTRRGRGSVFRRELVRAWLRGVGRDNAAEKPTRSAPAIVGGVAACIALVMVGYITLVVFLVVFRSTGMLVAGRAAASNWRASFAEDSSRPMSFPELQDLMRHSSVPQDKGAPDAEAARLILGRSYMDGKRQSPSDSLFAMFDMDINGARRVQQSAPEPVQAQDLKVLLGVLGDSNPPSRQRLNDVASYAISPWLPVWRRLARSSDLPTLWLYKRGLPGARYLWDTPVFPFGRLKDLAYRNAIAGYVALSRGDVATAILRARENIGAGRQLMRGGTELDDLVGLVTTGIGRWQLWVIGHATHNQSLMDEVTRLRAASIRWRVERLPALAALALTADPTNRDVLPLVKQIDAPVAYFGLMFHTMSGYCSNPRELLFGSDRARYDLLHAIALASSIPRATELERLGRNWLDDSNAGAARQSLLTRSFVPIPLIRKSSLPLAPLGWIGLRGFRDRAALCAEAAEM